MMAQYIGVPRLTHVSMENGSKFDRMIMDDGTDRMNFSCLVRR